MSNSTSPPPASLPTPSPPTSNSTTTPPPASLPSPQPPSSTTASPPSASQPSPEPPSNSTSSPPPGPSSTSPPPNSPPPNPPPSDSPPSPPSPPAPRTPPPPSRPSSKPSPSPPHSKTNESTPSSGNVSTGLVVGVAVAGVLLLLLLTCVFLCCRRKRKPAQPLGRKEEIYSGQVQGWPQNVQLHMDHVVKPPPHLSPPVHASRPPNPPMLPQLPPPPPPPVFSSTGDSGSNYSGSEIVPPPSPGLVLGLSKSTFTFDELMLATRGFSDSNLLGQGGFGYVHKGVLPNGKEIAVKQLKSGSGQGDREFQAEVEIISRVHHKHLVSLVGYCITGDKRLLVYEFVPNDTLEFHLHGKGRPCLDWPTRLKIALGSAKGLAYLHEDCNPKIIHRDIKAANILLDFKFEPKVADFGLAKFSSDNNTHVSTRVMGTFGYMAPEYASSGKLTEKSDVFSFGVMLLELITGKRPVDSTNSYMDDSLVDWARPLLTRAIEEGNYIALADPRMQQAYSNEEMACMVACAASCVRHSARRRPRMSQVVRALEGDVALDDFSDGVKPGHSSVYGSYGSSDYDQYQEEMKRFRKLALASQEYPTAGYSEPMSGYGQNPSGSSSEGQSTCEMELRNTEKASRGFR